MPFLVAPDPNGSPNLGGKRAVLTDPADAFAKADEIDGAVYALERIEKADAVPVSASAHVTLSQHVDVLPTRRKRWWQ
jgi:hypothetical protein